MLTTYTRALKEWKAMDNPLGRRQEDRIITCLLCADVLAIYQDGGRVPETPHTCAAHDALDRDLYEREEILDEIRAGKGEVHD